MKSVITLKQAAHLRRLMKGKRGVVLWRGRSLFNGAKIAVVLRLSGNSKTGASNGYGGMHTTYIVNDDELTFNEARQQGCDDGNCGDCDLRGVWDIARKIVTDRLCYVPGHGLHGLYESIARGNYPNIWDLADETGIYIADLVSHISPASVPLRIGGWGDGALVPWQIWEALSAEKRPMMTSYTHQWRWLEIHQGGYNWQCDYIKGIAMASCHKPQDVIDADKLGWRKFITVPTPEAVAEALDVPQVRYVDGQRRPTPTSKAHVKRIIVATLRRLKGDDAEFKVNALCAADKSLDEPLTCDICPIGCNGKNPDNNMSKADVWIHIHGPPSVISAWKRSPHWKQWIFEFTKTQQLLKGAVA